MPLRESASEELLANASCQEVRWLARPLLGDCDDRQAGPLAVLCPSTITAAPWLSSDQAPDEHPHPPPEHSLCNEQAGQPRWQIGLTLNLFSGRVACGSGEHRPIQGENDLEFDGDEHGKAHVSQRRQIDEQLLL